MCPACALHVPCPHPEPLATPHTPLHADNSGKISLSELIDRRVKAVERAMKEDAEVFSENLVEGGLAVVASGEITETIGKHAHQSGLTHGEVMA